MHKKKIRKFYKKVNARIADNRFLVRINIMLFPLFKYLYYKNERSLLKGKNISLSSKQSIVFFTAHKCASTYINNIIERLGVSNNVVPIHISNYFDKVDRDPVFKDKKFLATIFKQQGYYYGAFRQFHNIPEIYNYSVVLILRDPRDVLTSHYFSTLYNHPVVRKHALDNRIKYQNVSIDEYVLKNADEFVDVYQTYINNLLGKKNVLFLKYEDMIENFEPWLLKLAQHIQLDNDKALLKQIVAESNFTVKGEDKHSFIRNIKAGDHINKLKPETIQGLNLKFSNILNTLNYTI